MRLRKHIQMSSTYCFKYSKMAGLTDGQGRVVDFRNTIIIMTSNLGSRDISAGTTIGFLKIKSNFENMETLSWMP